MLMFLFKLIGGCVLALVVAVALLSARHNSIPAICLAIGALGGLAKLAADKYGPKE